MEEATVEEAIRSGSIQVSLHLLLKEMTALRLQNEKLLEQNNNLQTQMTELKESKAAA